MRRLGAAAAALALAAAGCGGDEEERTVGGGAGESAPRATIEERTDTAGDATLTLPEQERNQSTSIPPEEQPGGAGDEEPAQSQARFTGRDGRIRPRVVRVPPFLAIRVELRSADGRAYGLRVGRRTLRTGPDISSASSRVPGLRPGKALVARPIGAGNPVRIEATAQPGP